MTFTELKVADYIIKALDEQGITTPTPIQAQSIDPVIEGKDVLGKSATGSGKTLAFSCGVIQNTQPGQGVQSVVLAPTRELAIQVMTAIKDFSKYHKVRVNHTV